MGHILPASYLFLLFWAAGGTLAQEVLCSRGTPAQEVLCIANSVFLLHLILPDQASCQSSYFHFQNSLPITEKREEYGILGSFFLYLSFSIPIHLWIVKGFTRTFDQAYAEKETLGFIISLALEATAFFQHTQSPF